MQQPSNDSQLVVLKKEIRPSSLLTPPLKYLICTLAYSIFEKVMPIQAMVLILKIKKITKGNIEIHDIQLGYGQHSDPHPEKKCEVHIEIQLGEVCPF